MRKCLLLSRFIRKCFLIAHFWSLLQLELGRLWDDGCSVPPKHDSSMLRKHLLQIEDTFKEDQVCSPFTLSHVSLLNCSCLLEHYQPLVVNYLFFCLVTSQEEFRLILSSVEIVKTDFLSKLSTRMQPPSYGSTDASKPVSEV